MKKNKFCIFLLLSALLISCVKNINSPIKHFDGKPVKRIYPSKVIDLENFGILKPVRFIQIDDSIFVVEDRKTEDIFNLINLSSRKVISGINIGQGPGEILGSMNLQYRDNKVLVYDIMQKKMNEIIVSDTTLAIKEVYKIETEVPYLWKIYQLDSTFIATGWFEDYWLAEMNKDGKIFSTIDFPIWEEIKGLPKTVLSSLYIGAQMANSPDNKRVVVAHPAQGELSFFNRTEPGIKLYKQLKYHMAKFTVNEGGVAGYPFDNVEGFQGVDCDDTYVYTIYSGRTRNSHGSQLSHCEHLLEYDWNGNPVKRYILDIPIHGLLYDKARNRIYGLADNPEGVLVEYQL